MAEKTLCVTSPNGDQRMLTVMDTTTVKEILQQFHEDEHLQDRQATLLRGVTVLEPDLTVSEAGLEEVDEISLVWSDPFVEMERWTGLGDGYVRIPPGTRSIDERAFDDCSALVKIVIPESVISIKKAAWFCLLFFLFFII